MYVTTNSGLGARRRRGFGDVSCPGDPSCPGYVAPGSTDWQNSMLSEILANQTAATAATAATASTSTLTSWMNANGTLLAVGAGALLLLAFMGKR